MYSYIKHNDKNKKVKVTKQRVTKREVKFEDNRLNVSKIEIEIKVLQHYIGK